MKTNVLKSSLAAFTFTLAIVTSFAFSAPTEAQFYHNGSICDLIPAADKVNEAACKVTYTGPVCTTIIDGIVVVAYQDWISVTICTSELREEEF